MRKLLGTSALFLFAAVPLLRAQDAKDAPTLHRPTDVVKDTAKDEDEPKPVEKATPPVTVPVLVREHKGTPVVDLPQTAFTLKFDGKVQPVSEVVKGAATAVTFGLLVDVGNGQRNTLDDVRKAARAFLAQLRPGDSMFVVQFAKDIELLQGPTTEKQKLERAISELGTSSPTFHATEKTEDTIDSEGRKVHHGGTSLDDAIFLASDEVLSKEPAKRVLVVFSDGVDNGSKTSAGDMLESVMRNNVVIFGVFSRNADEITKKARDQQQPRNGGSGSPGSGRTGYPFPGSGGGGYPGSYPGSSPSGGSNPNGGSTPQRPSSEPAHRPDVDGFGALKKLSEETGGRMAEYGKRGEPLADSFAAVAADMQAMYWVKFTPQDKATRHGVHPFDIEVAGSDKSKKVDVQTSDDFYVP